PFRRVGGVGDPAERDGARRAYPLQPVEQVEVAVEPRWPGVRDVDTERLGVRVRGRVRDIDDAHLDVAVGTGDGRRRRSGGEVGVEHRARGVEVPGDDGRARLRHAGHRVVAVDTRTSTLDGYLRLDGDAGVAVA